MTNTNQHDKYINQSLIANEIQLFNTSCQRCTYNITVILIYFTDDIYVIYNPDIKRIIVTSRLYFYIL